MYKQSHIVLANFCANELQADELIRHKPSLSYGSVEPDMTPRQRMKEHEFDATWEDTKERIRRIEAMTITDERSERKLCREIGMVQHYLADYFTCPHNPSYQLGMIRHSVYEGRQQLHFRLYLHSKKSKEQFLSQKQFARQIQSAEELFAHIERMHGLYLQEKTHTPESDCRWILGVCACATMVLMAKVYENTGQDAWIYDSAA